MVVINILHLYDFMILCFDVLILFVSFPYAREHPVSTARNTALLAA